MASTNIAELRANLSRVLERVAGGEAVEVCRRNVPIARIVPLERRSPNRTELGCGAGTVVIKGDLTEPAWSTDDWDMLKA